MRIADAVYLLDGRSRQLLPALLYLPTSVWVAGNCSLRCSTFPRPCGSPATAPCVALPSHVRVGRRQLLPALLSAAVPDAALPPPSLESYLPTSLNCLFLTQSTSSVPGVVWVACTSQHQHRQPRKTRRRI